MTHSVNASKTARESVNGSDQEKTVSSRSTISVIVLGIASAICGPADGSDGVEFQVMPISVEDQCSRTILKGTGRLAGSAWLAPRVFVSMNRRLETLFEIITTQTAGESLVRFGLYFPFTDEAYKLREGTTDLILHGCDLGAVRRNLNENLSTPTERIAQFGSLPIKYMEVSIDGIEGKATIGGRNTEVLSYLGTDHVVEFRVPSDQVGLLLEKIGGRVGLGVKIDMVFSARSSNGYTEVRFNRRDLQVKLRAALSGRVQVTDVELEAAVATSLSQMDLEIYHEQGEPSPFDDLARQIVDQLLKVPDISADPADSDPAAPSENAPSNDAGRKLVKVNVALAAVESTVSSRARLLNMGARRDVVYSAAAHLSGAFDSPGRSSVDLYSDEGPRTLPLALSEGQSVSLVARAIKRQELLYETRSRLLARKEMREAGLEQVFSDIDYLDVEDMSYEDQTFATRLDNAWTGCLFSGALCEYSSWGVEETKYSGVRSLGTESLSMSASQLGSIPLEVSFEHNGRAIALSALADLDSSFLIARHDPDSEVVTLTAKRDLGRVRLAHVGDVEWFDLATRKYFHEVRGIPYGRFVSWGEREAFEYEASWQTSRRTVRSARKRTVLSVHLEQTGLYAITPRTRLTSASGTVLAPGPGRGRQSRARKPGAPRGRNGQAARPRPPMWNGACILHGHPFQARPVRKRAARGRRSWAVAHIQTIPPEVRPMAASPAAAPPPRPPRSPW